MVSLMKSMCTIKAVSGELLSQKIKESDAISPYDSISKKDIMSLLICARANEEKVNMLTEKGTTSWILAPGLSEKGGSL